MRKLIAAVVLATTVLVGSVVDTTPALAAEPVPERFVPAPEHSGVWHFQAIYGPAPWGGWSYIMCLNRSNEALRSLRASYHYVSVGLWCHIGLGLVQTNIYYRHTPW